MPKMVPSLYCIALATTFIVCTDISLAQATAATTVHGLNYKHFAEVLSDISLSTTHLTIKDTSIEHLDFDALLLHVPQLESLSVINNKELHSTTGQINSPALVSLYLTSNSLSAYPSFESCPELVTYHVKDNAQALPKLNTADIVNCTRMWEIKLENVGLEYFPNFAHMNFSIQIIHISNLVNLVNVDEEALLGLYGLTHLRIYHTYMSTIPNLKDLMALEVFDIQACTVMNKEAINWDWFYAMPKLRALTILTSSLQFTKPPDMRHLPQLKTFSIIFDASASVHLPADYLNTQPALTYLRLQNVEMEQLLPQAATRHSLGSLNLYWCPISNLTGETFKGFDRLREMILHGTNVRELPLLSDSYLTLVTFYLSGILSGNLTIIPAGHFSNFSQLLTVSLEGTQVTEVPYLGENIRVTVLRLSQNKITSVASNAFEGFCCLTELNLEHNKLQSISFTIPLTLEKLDLQDNKNLNITVSDFPFTNGSLRTVWLGQNLFECDRKMCFTLMGPWASIFKLPSKICSAPSDLVGKSNAEVTRSLSCPEEACSHVPAIANASSEVMSKYVWYTCDNDLLFADGVQKRRLLCQSAILATDDIISAGCKRFVSNREKRYIHTGVQSYSDEESCVIGKTTRVEEYVMAAPNELSCARLCSRLTNCVRFKVVYPDGGRKGKCEVNIVES